LRQIGAKGEAEVHELVVRVWREHGHGLARRHLEAHIAVGLQLREEQVVHVAIDDAIGGGGAVAGLAGQIVQLATTLFGRSERRKLLWDRDLAERQPVLDELGDEPRARRGKHLALEQGDLLQLAAQQLGPVAVAGHRRLRLLFERRLAAVELIRRREGRVGHTRNATPDRDGALGRADHVAIEVDHIHVVRQRQNHAHEPLLQVLERGLRRLRVVGVQALEQGIERIGEQPRLHALGAQRGVLLEHVAARARATVRARERLFEQSLAALGPVGVGRARRERLLAQNGFVLARAG
jgi:hypothetical protein